MGRGLDGYLISVHWHCVVLKVRGEAVSHRFPVAMARGKHLFPFRTEQLSPSAPMVLGPQGPGRVGRRRFFLRHTSRPRGGSWSSYRAQAHLLARSHRARTSHAGAATQHRSMGMLIPSACVLRRGPAALRSRPGSLPTTGPRTVRPLPGHLPMVGPDRAGLVAVEVPIDGVVVLEQQESTEHAEGVPKEARLRRRCVCWGEHVFVD